MPPSDAEPTSLRFQVDATTAGERLDAFLARQLPQFSRTFLRRAISGDLVTVDGRRRKPAYVLHDGQRVVVLPPEVPREGPQPEPIPLEILFEDEHVVVVNKPTGMVVHPGKGHWQGTLTSALAFHFQQLSSIGGVHRPGIVHRLDRDTSGVMIVAKTDQAHLDLSRQFAARDVTKEYLAVSRGSLDRDRDWVTQPIGVHPIHRERMAIRPEHATSRDASTFIEVRERLGAFLLVRAFPKTGRTHQIRVHLAHLGCPVLCDPLYSGRKQITWGEIHNQPDDHRIALDRLALHARRLSLRHPVSGRSLELEAPVPPALERLIDGLRARSRTDRP
jgi:23S rRNA pseudouridine1911/1915/1917 synthase